MQDFPNASRLVAGFSCRQRSAASGRATWAAARANFGTPHSPEPWGSQAPELSAASGSASASDLGRRASDFNLDDLLGLGSPEPPSPAPSAAPGTPAAAATPAAEDPFQARHR